jgi:DivIVA domain-containing protein
MDITPQLLKEVKFSESWRGYDRDEVDEFLERVGAGVAQVQGRLRESIDRAEAAEARAVALGGRSEAQLNRLLVEGGLQVSHVARETPSLESLFFRIAHA